MAHTILRIDSSPLGERSVTRRLTSTIIAELMAKTPNATIVTRDIAANPLPHISGLEIGAFFTPPDKRTEAQAESLRLSDQAVDEILAADVIVIGAPMHNFTIPSSLKAWIDHIVRPGRTFKYGPAGPEGLVPSAKKVIVASARGSIYSDGPMKSLDYQETYLKAVLGFIGLQNVSFVRAEGVSRGEEAATAAIKSAEMQAHEAVRDAA